MPNRPVSRMNGRVSRHCTWAERDPNRKCAFRFAVSFGLLAGAKFGLVRIALRQILAKLRLLRAQTVFIAYNLGHICIDRLSPNSALRPDEPEPPLNRDHQCLKNSDYGHQRLSDLDPIIGRIQRIRDHDPMFGALVGGRRAKRSASGASVRRRKSPGWRSILPPTAPASSPAR